MTMDPSVAVSELVGMGFNESEAIEALKATNYHLENAIERLLGGNNVMENINDRNRERVVVLGISQYTFSEMGASACTSISVAAMMALLEHYDRDDQQRDMISEEQLSNSVICGVMSHGGAGHASVEELLLLSPDLNSKLTKLVDQENNLPIQGILTQPTPFELLLDKVTSLTQNRQKSIGVIITKPPETVVVILPAAASAADHGEANDGNRNRYALFDSHSRPQLGIEGSYLVETSQRAEIINRLHDIFPLQHSFGDEIESSMIDENETFMTEMYATFEGSAFQLTI